MGVQSVTPMLVTTDLKGTVAFYVDVLGFSARRVEEGWGWASASRDGVEVMFCTPNEHEHNPWLGPKFTGSLYFRVDDADAEWARVKDKAKVCYPIEDFHYGMREFAVYDCNGYLLQFGAPIKTG